MKKKRLYVFTAAALSFCSVAMAADKGIDGCIEMIKKQKEGDIVKIESLNSGEKLFYEIEVKDATNKKWDLTCDAADMKLVGIEEKYSLSDSTLFKKNAKLSENEAIKIALKSHSGKILEVEYEIKNNGPPTYEIDIDREDGKETKVEVNAVSGEIINIFTENWEVGDGAR